MRRRPLVLAVVGGLALVGTGCVSTLDEEATTTTLPATCQTVEELAGAVRSLSPEDGGGAVERALEDLGRTGPEELRAAARDAQEALADLQATAEAPTAPEPPPTGPGGTTTIPLGPGPDQPAGRLADALAVIDAWTASRCGGRVGLTVGQGASVASTVPAPERTAGLDWGDITELLGEGDLPTWLGEDLLVTVAEASDAASVDVVGADRDDSLDICRDVVRALSSLAPDRDPVVVVRGSTGRVQASTDPDGRCASA